MNYSRPQKAEIIPPTARGWILQHPAPAALFATLFSSPPEFLQLPLQELYLGPRPPRFPTQSSHKEKETLWLLSVIPLGQDSQEQLLTCSLNHPTHCLLFIQIWSSSVGMSLDSLLCSWSSPGLTLTPKHKLAGKLFLSSPAPASLLSWG